MLDRGLRTTRVHHHFTDPACLFTLRHRDWVGGDGIGEETSAEINYNIRNVQGARDEGLTQTHV